MLREPAPEKHIADTELLFQKALDDLRTHGDTEVNFEHLLELAGIYNKFYEKNEIVEKRWLGYSQEIAKLLEEAEHKEEAALKQMMDADGPITAYQKANEMVNK